MLIGWASADVTPDRPVILRGQFHARISVGVGDPLSVTALALEGKGADGRPDCAVFVSCDRVGVPSVVVDRVRDRVRELAPGLDPLKVTLSATHTHTAPEMEDGIYPPQGPEVTPPTEYCELFVQRAAEAVAHAWNTRAEGKVAWGLGHAVVGRNRRATYAGGTSVMYGKTDRADFSHIEGYEDHGVDLLYTWDAAGDLTGVVINAACPSQVSEGDLVVSADFWHEVRAQVKERMGAGVHVLGQCAAAGDQSPHVMWCKRAEERMYALRGLSERDEIARRFAATAQDVAAIVKPTATEDAPLVHLVREVSLPARLVTRAEYEEARARLAEHEPPCPDPADNFATSVRFVMLRRYGAVVRRYQTQQEQMTYSTEVHAVRIGDIAFATNPFELFLDFGIRMKARSRALQTFVVQLTGTGRNTMSCYLSTERAAAARSYGAEVADNVVGAQAGQVLVDTTVEMLDELFPAE